MDEVVYIQVLSIWLYVEMYGYQGTDATILVLDKVLMDVIILSMVYESHSEAAGAPILCIFSVANPKLNPHRTG